jgi:membrane fusion protein, heavy metal efflux system
MAVLTKNKMKKSTLKIFTFLTCLGFLLNGCGTKEVHDAEEEHAHAEEHPDDVHLVQNQMDAMDIKLGGFKMLNLSTTVKASGQLELPPQKKASVSALMEGRIKIINVVEGDFVNKGDVLATMENPAYIDMQQRYLEARSKFAYLKQDFERKESLIKSKAVPQKAYDEAKANYLSIEAKTLGLGVKLAMFGADIDLLKKKIIVSRFHVTSPIRGFVRLVEVNIGKFVSAEQELFEIVDNEHIHIDLRVYEKDMHLVKNKQKVMFSLPNQPQKVMEGKIFAVGKAFETDHRAMMVHAEITNNQSDILPGMYVDARIITDTKMAQSLPNDAIVSDGGLNYIFVLKPRREKGHEEEYVFRKIEVNLGATDIGYSEVTPTYKLPKDVKIVVQGAFYLLAEMKKGEGGHGHHH